MTERERPIPQIADAEAGDAEAGRELLSMASLQIRQLGQLEPALARYLADKLDDVRRSPASDAGRLLNIHKSNPKHRLADSEKIKRQLLALGRAQEMISVQGDTRDLIDLAGEAKKEVECANNLDSSEREEELESCLTEFIDQYYGLCSKELSKKDVFDLAARLFNRDLQNAQESGQRTNEKPITRGSITKACSRARKEK